MSVEDKTITVTDADFESAVLKADKPVIVDFWAGWCQPCKQIAPSLEAIADEMGGQVIVAKVNVDENPQTAMQYSVRSLPTLLLFKTGAVAATQIGAAPKSKLESWAQANI